ncbi:amidohydrolase [Streptomyces sp. cg36]|uniref:amidohydrolase family protein n=1 Tax=Streptomyces sp. cg36 TaxID=3238798 RepID=UPI0034E19BB7
MNTATAPADTLFDCHFHIIDPRFPLLPNSGFLPEPFTVEDYLRRTLALGVTGGAVVSASFQAYDQDYLLEALRQLGPGFVGVTQLPAGTSDSRILALHRAGVRALRFNLYRNGPEAPARLKDLAHRVHDLVGWHVELYVDAKDLRDLEPVLLSLPRISIDHLGMSSLGHSSLLRLVESGAKVKATGFGRVSLDVASALRQVHRIDPTALMAGTDLPSTRARRPFRDGDIRLIGNTLGPEALAAVLRTNARTFYGFPR